MIYVDQLMREVQVSEPPSRIISLVPSLTELLFDLGLENEIVGITKFCIHPEKIFRTKMRIGGTKKINHSIIKKLNPDLIIANKEENVESDIRQLESDFPVWVSDIKTLDDAYEMIEKIGEVTYRKQEAAKICNEIKQQFLGLSKMNHIKTLYLVWKDPYIAAGSDSFINDMMNRCGMANVLAHQTRYPQLTDSEIKGLDPSLVLLSSEPYPFKEKHIEDLLKIIPEATIITVDGECFSWYGSRLISAPSYFNSLINSTKNNLTN